MKLRSTPNEPLHIFLFSVCARCVCVLRGALCRTKDPGPFRSLTSETTKDISIVTPGKWGNFTSDQCRRKLCALTISRGSFQNFPFLSASPRIKLILWAGWHLSDRITNEKKMRVWHWVCLNKRSCLFFKLAKNLANFNLPDSWTVSCCSSNQSVEGCHQV